MQQEQALRLEHAPLPACRQPWLKPVLKKGEIGLVTANVGGRYADGGTRGMNS
jgi:hypothetical protein